VQPCEVGIRLEGTKSRWTLREVTAPASVVVDLEHPHLRLKWPSQLGPLTSTTGAHVEEYRSTALTFRATLRPHSETVALTLGPA
jgi:hypothetical protein